jgi:hypothetical protein
MYLSAYILNVCCHRVPGAKKFVDFDIRTGVLATQVVVRSAGNLKRGDQMRPLH